MFQLGTDSGKKDSFLLPLLLVLLGPSVGWERRTRSGEG